MYKVLMTSAAMLLSGVAYASSLDRIAYAPASGLHGCSSIQEEARVVQRQVIDLGSAMSHRPDIAMAPYADAGASVATGSVAQLGFELDLAWARMVWLREAARQADCREMPAWHELERVMPWRDPVA
ncbi:MAG: hypothetical protein AB7O39_06270 [Flavobacteriaceae bacterium]